MKSDFLSFQKEYKTIDYYCAEGKGQRRKRKGSIPIP